MAKIDNNSNSVLSLENQGEKFEKELTKIRKEC